MAKCRELNNWFETAYINKILCNNIREGSTICDLSDDSTDVSLNASLYKTTPEPTHSSFLDTGDISQQSAVKEEQKKPVDPLKVKFACEYEQCKSTFTSKYGLNRHISSQHQKIKQFKCNFCTQQFSQKVNKERHEKTVHANALLAN